jgi:hypothetical protein
MISLCYFSLSVYTVESKKEEEQPEKVLTKKQIYYIHLSFLYRLVFSIIDAEKQRAHVLVYTEDKSSLP